MEIKKIELPGIVRAFPDNISQDGVLHDMINLRKYKGGIRPIGLKDMVHDTNLPEDRPIFIHHTTDGKKFIFGHEADGTISYVEFGTENALTDVETHGANDVIRFSSMFNVLMIINETDETISYAVYSPDAGTYSDIGDVRFPETLDITFTIGATISHSTEFFETGDVATDERAEYAKNLLLKLEKENNKDGYFTGLVLFRYAYEMYDGTIIKHSAPIFLKNGVWKWYQDSSPATDDRIRVFNGYNNLYYNIITSDADLNAIRAKYGDLVRSVNIYMTRPINCYDPDYDNITTYSGEGSSYAVEMAFLNFDDLYKELGVGGDYRLVQKINLNELSFSSNNSLDIGDVNNIPSKKALTVDNFTHHNVYGANDFKYNSRWWLGNVKTTLFKGFSPSMFVIQNSSIPDTGTAYDVYFEVDIKGLDGTKTVRSDSASFNYYNGASILFLLKEFFAYPDSRATLLRIMVDDGVEIRKAGELNLTAHTIYNIAYRIREVTDSFAEADFGSATSLTTVLNEINDNSRIQASLTENPFYFPAKNSYRAGSTKVIAMGANSIPLDTGQFGQYPLFAFCEDGIWALHISNSADILVDSIVPTSGEVCNSKSSVLSTEYGAVFETAEGLYVINQRKPDKLSYALEGDYVSLLNGNLNLDDIKQSVTIADTSDYPCVETFINYLSGAKVGYDHVLKELIISNNTRNFSWHYSFNSQSWFKSSLVFNSFVSSYPKMYGETGAELFDLTEEDWSVTKFVPCYFESKPIKFDHDSLKKIDRMALRGILDTQTTKGAGLYIFASIEGVEWYYMLGYENIGKFKDLLLTRTPYSAVQFIVVFSGTIGEDSVFTHLDTVTRNKFMNRLR